MLDLKNCTMCPRRCGIDRTKETGFCRSSDRVKVNLHQLHHWEEPVISGTRGSGTIFFSNCNLRCVFCQNYRISAHGLGTECTASELADMMLALQDAGAHNINLVTPTHFTSQIIEAARTARRRGLVVPILWNSNGYEEADTLRELEGIVDIYLPDFKYFTLKPAERYSSAADYPEKAKAAILEMYRQVGHLRMDNGIAVRGLLVRILVLPGNSNGTGNILRWIRDAIGDETFVSLMGQYYPAHRAAEFPEINRPVTAEEYHKAVRELEECGFENGFLQKVGSSADYTPDFISDSEGALDISID